MASLAIAAPEFASPSVTFIRDHARLISPKRTVLLSRANEDLGFLKYPAITGISTPHNLFPAFLPGRVVKATNTFGRRFFGLKRMSLPKSDVDRCVDFLKSHQCDAMMTEFLTEGVAFMEVAVKAGVRLYPHAHGFDVTSVPQSEKRWTSAYIELFSVASGVFVPSAYLADRVEALGCPSDKITISPCGVAPDQFPEALRKRGRILAVGRLVEKKAPQQTIRAFAIACDEHPDARLDIVGDGPLKNACKALAEQLGVVERVTFHGALPHDAVRTLMQSASVFAQHSIVASNGDTEGLPVAILEAMASGLPVVSTRHSGIPEAVQATVTGLLVDEYDFRAMGTALAQLLSEPASAARMGRAGRSKVEQCFTQTHMIQILRKTILGV